MTGFRVGSGIVLLCTGAAVVLTVLSPTRTSTGARQMPSAFQRNSVGRSSYGWPLKPFFKQHIVIAQFGDPRINQTRSGRRTYSIHFGVDISAPDGTPVYSTISGRAIVRATRVSVQTVDARELEFWHITPAVTTRTPVVAYETILGRIAAGKRHVHVAESLHGRYFNPLRKHGMMPFVDHTTPVIHGLVILAGASRLTAGDLKGVVDLAVEAYDLPALPITDPVYADNLVTPARLDWHVATIDGKSISRWITAFDVSTAFPSLDYSRSAYDSVYARKTRQNEPQRPCLYRFYLVHGLNTRKFANGRYLVEVRARDVRGNRALLRQAIRIANPAQDGR